MEEKMVFNNIKDFMRFVNNYNGESVIKGKSLYDKKTNQVIAEYSGEE